MRMNCVSDQFEYKCMWCGFGFSLGYYIFFNRSLEQGMRSKVSID